MSFLEARDGARLRYTVCGPTGRTVVLLHGWKGSHRLWDPAIYRLSRELRVVAFDQRGMGESDKPTGAYDFGVLADDLGFVLETLGLDSVTLVGWSMGCSVALEYLERGGERVRNLVLVNGPLKLTRSAELEWTMTEEQLSGYLADLAANWPSAERAFARGAVLDPDSDFADLYYRVALQTPLEVAMRIVHAQAALDHVPLLARLEVPVLALYGRHDPYYPTELASFIAESVRDGEAVIFEESAHAPHYDEADRFCEVVGAFARRG